LPKPHGVDATLILKPGREKSLLRHHPWIFSGAIDRVGGAPASGASVLVETADGRFLARAAFSPASQIRARVWTFDPAQSVDAPFLQGRIQAATARRSQLRDARNTACRLIHAEADGLPGLIADRYGDTVVFQISAAGPEFWRDAIVTALAAEPGVACVYERSDVEVRALEGLAPRTGAMRGTLPSDVTMREDGIAYRVDIAAGHKTGFYLDQRDNRIAVRALAAGRAMLNVFCYTGGFSLAGLAGGAKSVLSIDSAADALALARANLELNPELPADRATWKEGDAFTELRRLRDAGARFDLIVLDPPKFAPTAAHAERAARAYKDINLLALKLLRNDGLLATFSCSATIDAKLFAQILAGAAQDAGTDAAILRRFAASPDHPVTLAFPEGEYLKGLLLRKLG
jgi:23S rRNA (cytosine1962-C5)-methyltransferase